MKPNDITDGGRAWRQQDSVRQPGGTSRKRRRPQSALVVAATGLLLARWSGHPARDGVASIAIGAILMTVSFLLARETLGLLTGESADPGTIRSIRAIAEADPSVARVGQALTAHFGPDDVVLNLELFFRPDRSMAEVAAAIDRLERRIRERHPEMTYVFIGAEALSPTIGGQASARWRRPRRPPGRADGRSH